MPGFFREALTCEKNRDTRRWWPLGLFLFSLSIMGIRPVQAQMVTVNPIEAPGALTNPLMGFRGGSSPYVTVVQQYIPWSAIENLESDSVQKIRDFCNSQWANHPANNIRVIPRVYVDWDWNAGNEHWPADLQKGDWTSQQFKDRVVRLVGRLGEVWNNDPRVAWVQTGLIGYWGEQESPVGVGQDGWAKRLGDAYTAAFPNKQFIVRNMGAWPGYNVGVYWDSFGHPGQRPWAWTEIKNFNNQGRYLTRVIEGETALDWGVEGEFASLYGGIATPMLDAQGQPVLDAQGNPEMSWTSNANVLLGNAQYTDNMTNVIRELHCSALGWISGYNPNDPTIATNAARMQKEFGYRFHLSEFSCDARANPGSSLNLQFKVKNKGSAPMYENWPLAVTLIDKNTRQLLWKATIPNIDIRKWHPGHDYNYTTRIYQTPAQEHLISASIPLPANLPVGEHLIGLTILEPLSRTPGLFFAVPNFFKTSQTQPLAKIGIGMDATGHTLDGVAFDDLVNDDTRSYAVTPQGPFYTLVAEHSDLGMISQQIPNGRYAKDTGVEVRAIGKAGYRFSSWSGVLGGSTKNPAMIVMDGNKSVSANYVPVATCRLNTTSSNGTITLSPPGGIYNVGTEVTVTAVPSGGYALGSWSGDLNGSASSATITMTSDKNVTANFFIAPVVGPTSYRVNSGGPTYTAGDEAIFIADTGGNTWSTSAAISGTTDDALYLTERYGGSFVYNIPLVNGSYDVTLMFAEIFHSINGSRVFNVSLEGNPVITNLDIHSKVGKNAAYNEQHIVNVTDGQLNIAFNAAVNGHDAKISAIKVTRIQRPNSFTLVSNATNGAITSDSTAESYDNGSVLTVAATPNTGYKFDSWSGDLSGTANPATLTINGNKTVTANFSPIATSYTLSTSATHGSIAINPFGGIYHNGASVTLSAVPPAGYRFDSWGGDLSGTTNPATLVMNGNKSVSANFSWITHNLAITPPGNGSISSNPSGAVQDDGTVVTLTATPASGYEFEAWGGDLADYGYATQATLTMNGNKSVSAFFRPAATTIDTTGSSIGMPRVLARGKEYIGNGFLSARGLPGTDIQLNDTTNEFAMTGGLFTIEAGVEVTNNWGVIWTNNKSDMRIEGIYDISHNSMSQTRVDALTGTGAIHFHDQPWENNKILNLGVDNGSGAFSGTIEGIHPWSGNGVNIIKHGTGTQTFDNLLNQPVKTLQINQGVFELSNPTTVPISFAAPISGAGNLTKSGSGPLTLSGALTYSGNTVIAAGTLSIPQPAFADTSTVAIGLAAASPAVLNLPNVGTDILAQLIIDGVARSGNGAVYDSLNSSGAITGIGKIQVGLPVDRTVLLVVGSSLGASDIAIRRRLESYGFKVQTISDSAATTADASEKVLVITSSSVLSTNVSTKFQSVAVPVINWETALQDEQLFTTVANQGTANAQTSLNIINPSHPLAANLPAGPSTVSAAPSGFSWGQPTTSAIIIARLNESPDHPCIYAYETGAALTNGMAAARRVHLFLQNETFASLTADGRKLFDAAVSWALNQVLAGGPPGPSSIDYAEWATAHTLLSGSSDDDKDGRTNYEEYAFGQNPKNGASANPVSISPSISGGTFSYTRRKSSLTGLSYSVWYSNSLDPGSWMKDNGAVEGTPVPDGEIETVTVTLSSALLSSPKLFIQVRTE